MRTEAEMMDLILNIARENERIRAVIMNGSRTSPNSPRDIFQDYDIVYVVTDLAPFKRNFEWIKQFGEIMILQLPDDMVNSQPSEDESFAYLMQFVDGNRIDLTIFPITSLDKLGRDSQSLLLMDKDKIIEPFPPPNDADYLPVPPTSKAYSDCCNEFWWVSPYVAKGLWREQILYALNMFNIVREQLMQMLSWYIGVQTKFKQPPGYFGKYFQKYLEPALWDQLLKTYADASYEAAWEALFTMCDLFRIASRVVGDHFGYEYHQREDEAVSTHLRHVRALPRDAKEMY